MHELLGRLIDHYIILMNAAEQPLVIRKLASSLATVFLKPNSPWTYALINLAASLANGKYIAEDQCQSLDLGDVVLPVMSEPQVVSLLYFSKILGEEIERWSGEPQACADVGRVARNIEHAFCLVDVVLRHVLQQEASGIPVSSAAPGIEAINSYHVSQACLMHLVHVLGVTNPCRPG